MSDSDKQHFEKTIKEKLENIEETLKDTINLLINQDTSFWEIISKNPPKEKFPNPTEKQFKEVLQCCERAFLYYDSYQDKVAHMFYNLIKNHILDNGNKRIAVSIVLIVLNLDHLPDRDILLKLSLEVADSQGHDNKEHWIERIKQDLFSK